MCCKQASSSGRPCGALRRRLLVLRPGDFVASKTDPEHAREKIGQNAKCDRGADAQPEEEGWALIRLWEHHQGMEEGAQLVRDTVLDRCRSKSA